MAIELWIESTRKPGVEFKVLDYDKTTKKGVLIGKMGVKFEELMTKERLVANGYKLVQREVADK